MNCVPRRISKFQISDPRDTGSDVLVCILCNLSTLRYCIASVVFAFAWNVSSNMSRQKTNMIMIHCDTFTVTLHFEQPNTYSKRPPVPSALWVANWSPTRGMNPASDWIKGKLQQGTLWADNSDMAHKWPRGCKMKPAKWRERGLVNTKPDINGNFAGHER